MLHIDIIAGARPNFIKIAPIIHAIERRNNNSKVKIRYRFIHTGQHYDKRMSLDFLTQLQIPEPHFNLGVGSGSQAEQTANIMIKYEEILIIEKPLLCLVVGDVNSTMACAITAKKVGVKVAHVEGGIRSYDQQMPEEINRMVTDSISDYFFTTSENANEILRGLGHSEAKIFFVGNTMIDSLIRNLGKLEKPEVLNNSLVDKDYIVVTLHRPSNVDEYSKLGALLKKIESFLGDIIAIFPVHPRTQQIINRHDITFKNIITTPPLPYLEFIYLLKNALGIITDSGGITEEATVLGIPCITLRNSTERPETVFEGTNVLVGDSDENLEYYLNQMINRKWKPGKIPAMWDGKSAERIVNFLEDIFEL